METLAYESEHDTLLESDLFPTGPDSSTSIQMKLSDTKVQGVKTQMKHLAELPTPQENVGAKVESVTKKLEGVTQCTVPPENF